MKVLLLLVAVFVAFASAAPVLEDIPKILEQVPEEDRLRFIKYYAMVGYGKLHQKRTTFDERRLPDDFAVAVYQYMMENHAVRDPKLLNIARGIICFDDGTCIDGGDIGIHPI